MNAIKQQALREQARICTNCRYADLKKEDGVGGFNDYFCRLNNVRTSVDTRNMTCGIYGVRSHECSYFLKEVSV
jgi:hypothetical protein